MAKRKAKITPKNPTAEGLRNIVKMAKKAYAGNQAYRSAKKQYIYDKFTGNKDGMKEFHQKYGIPFGPNDLSWYNNYPELISGLITPNFMRKKGILEASYPGVAIPSVAGLQLEECLGSDVHDSYTSSMVKFLTSLRMANTGAQQYTKLDLEKYVLNVRAVLIAIRQLRRDYGLAMKFSALDKEIPQNFYTATAVTGSAITDNLADLRQFLNFSSEKLHVVTPVKMDILERTCWLCDNVFTDSDDAKCQYYIPYFDKVWYFNYASNTMSQVTIRAASFTFQQLINAVTGLISNLTNYDLNGIIAADILKAYGQEAMAYFSIMEENYSVNYVYSEEVLTQIQNATVFPVTHSIAINSAGDGLTENVYHTFTSDASGQLLTVYSNICSSKMINFYKDNITPLDVVGSTRLTCLGNLLSSTSPDTVQFTAYGTEILENVHFTGAGTPSGILLNWGLYDNLNGPASANDIRDLIFRVFCWATFDWMPSMRFIDLAGYDSSGTSVSYQSDLEIFDYNNYAKFTSVDQLQAIHDVAIQSLYYVKSKIRETKVTDLKEIE